MVPFSCLISDSGVVTVYVNGKPHTFASDYPQMDKVKKAIADKDVAEIVRLSNIPRSIENYAGATIKVENGVVHYKDTPLHNSLTKRILKLMSEGFPFTSMLKFLEKLMRNPSNHSVNELYNFLVNRNLPITENGNFLAYKAVRADYLDWHSGSIRNQVGDSPKRLERNMVDDDWRTECSNGYHVGAIEYVSMHYNSSTSGVDGHVMIVEVDPEDVISVPTNDNFQKCRCCFYTVVGEMDSELLAQVYKTTQNSYEPSVPAAVGSMSSVDDGFPSFSDSELDDDDDLDEDDLDDDADLDEDEDDLDDEDLDDEDEYGPAERN